MKKRPAMRAVAVLLALALCLCAVPAALAAKQEHRYGDLDESNTVNAADALQVLRIAVGKAKAEGVAATAGDVDGNKALNAADAMWILRFAVGKVTTFPVGLTFFTGEDDPPPVTPGMVAVPQLQDVSAYATTVEHAPYTATDFTTLTQDAAGYNDMVNLDVGCILYYSNVMPTDRTEVPWQKEMKESYNGDAVIGVMTAINRDTHDYIGKYDEGRGEDFIQTTATGAKRTHATDGYYMVPGRDYVEYKLDCVKAWIDLGAKVIAFEEPEIWNSAGYSVGFKEEYEAYWNTEWEDPSISPEAMWRSQYFKVRIFYNAFTYLAKEIKAYNPDVKVLVASHSHLSYTCHGISTGLAMYASVPGVDGIIAQTWSDDSRQGVPYNGVADASNIFMKALYDYNSYGEALNEGQSLYLLQDPSSDDQSFPWDYNEGNWRQTVVAALLQNDAASFEPYVWPPRCFFAAGMNYKTVQITANKMFNELADLPVTLYGGTPGITVATSDSIGWHVSGASTGGRGDGRTSLGGLYMSLQNHGVQLDSLCLDNLTSLSQLSDTNLLILMYDVTKPLSEKANEVIAEWVKGGGRLLCLGGDDPFVSLTGLGFWWEEQKTTPMENLLQHLGLGGITLHTGDVPRDSLPALSGVTPSATTLPTLNNYCELNMNMAAKTQSYTGSGFTTFMTAGGQSVGITAPAGKGQVTMVGLPSYYYPAREESNDLIPVLVELALQGAAVPYAEHDLFAASRGNYFAYYSLGVHALANERTFLNLFDASLEVVPGGSTIPRWEASLYYDATEAASDTIPRLAFTGGTELAERVETADQTGYTVAYPTGAVAATRLFGNGRYPQSVMAKTRSGAPVVVTTMWDEANGSLLVKAAMPQVTDPITVTVTWGDQFVQLPTEYVYAGVTVRTNDETLRNDADPLLYDGDHCSVNNGAYFCDKGSPESDRFVTWKIDLKTYIQPSMTLDVLGNWKLDYSFDGRNWQPIDSWQNHGSPVGVVTTETGETTKVDGGASRTNVTVTASDYGEFASAEAMYIRLSSCYMFDAANGHPGGDHGGIIYNYTLNYLKPADSEGE